MMSSNGVNVVVPNETNQVTVDESFSDGKDSDSETPMVDNYSMYLASESESSATNDDSVQNNVSKLSERMCKSHLISQRAIKTSSWF